jgi:hypothetical protein
MTYPDLHRNLTEAIDHLDYAARDLASPFRRIARAKEGVIVAALSLTNVARCLLLSRKDKETVDRLHGTLRTAIGLVDGLPRVANLYAEAVGMELQGLANHLRKVEAGSVVRFADDDPVAEKGMLG